MQFLTSRGVRIAIVFGSRMDKTQQKSFSFTCTESVYGKCLSASLSCFVVGGHPISSKKNVPKTLVLGRLSILHFWCFLRKYGKSDITTAFSVVVTGFACA